MPDLQEILKRNTLIKEPGKPLSAEDEELERVLAESMPKIFVVGSGGAGCNTVTRMTEIGISGAKIIAMNTDAQHLLRTRADKRMLLGKKKTKGLGAGSNPEVGQAAAEESEPELKEMFKQADLVFVTSGMGGGTGTGSSHVIARAAKQSGALVIGVVTMPFTSEGRKRMNNALVGLEKLRREADCTITIPNDKLLFYVPDLPLNAAFRAADMVLTNAVKGIVEVVTKPGLVNVDFADVRTILENSGLAVIGLGEVEKTEVADRAIRAAEKALQSPLLDIDVSAADRALVNITGGESMTLGEAESAVNSISEKVHKEAHVIWGATLDPEMPNNAIRVLAVLTGIKEVQQMATFKDADAAIESLEFV